MQQMLSVVRPKSSLGAAVAALDLQLDAQTWHEIWTAAAGHEVP